MPQLHRDPLTKGIGTEFKVTEDRVLWTFPFRPTGAFPDLRAAGSGPGRTAGHAGNSALTQG